MNGLGWLLLASVLLSWRVASLVLRRAEHWQLVQAISRASKSAPFLTVELTVNYDVSTQEIQHSCGLHGLGNNGVGIKATDIRIKESHETRR